MSEDQKLSPFDIINIINEKKEELDSDQLQQFYNAWMVNRGLSNVKDTVLFANEMNRLYSLPKDMQFAFYYHGISKKRRFGKWNKIVEEKQSIELIMEKYPHFSRKRAKELLPILKGQLKAIEADLYKGGNKKK